MVSVPGRVITFYSFKGGTGRTMALANVASSIAQRNGGKKVLAVDWDLEAPGLHRYFRPYVKVSDPDKRESEIDDHPGLIELLTQARDAAVLLPKNTERSEIRKAVFDPLDLSAYLMETDLSGLSLIKAGRFDTSYSSRINTFDWTGLFGAQPLFFGAFADYLSEKCDYVFIDSRTGHTDISGICTCLMPDTLVAVFTPNRQSLGGALDMVRQAVSYRTSSDDLRPLVILPVASRIEISEKLLNDSWRFGDPREELPGYQPEFERVLKAAYGLSDCDLTAYFDEAQVQYVPYYSFGEKIAVRLRETTTFSLARSYSTLTGIIVQSVFPWELPGAISPEQAIEPEPIPFAWDEAWFRGETSVHTAFPGSTLTVWASISTAKPSASRAKLLDAVKNSDLNMPPDLPPIFNGSPAPSVEGISFRETQNPLSFWSLRKNGDYVLVRMFPEFEKKTVAEWRIWQLTEVVLFCAHVYRSLGVPSRAEIQLLVEHSGLWARSLATVAEPDGLSGRMPASVGAVQKQVSVVLGRIESQLVQIVESLAAPVFEVFDFAEFDETFYRSVIQQLLELNEK